MRHFNFNKNTIDFQWILIPLICFIYVCCGTKWKKIRFIFLVPLNNRKHSSNRSTDREALYFSSRRDQGIWILKAAFRALMNIDIEQQRKTQQPKWSSCREPLEALFFPDIRTNLTYATAYYIFNRYRLSRFYYGLVSLVFSRVN